MRHSLISLLLLASAQAAAQAPAPQSPAPQTPPAAPAAQAPERKPLILDLDEDTRRQIMSGVRRAEQDAPRRGEALPSLGGDARKIDPAILRGKPYPGESYSDKQTPH